MPVCGPTNTIPSCAATPSVSFGSDNCGFGGALGVRGYGSLGYGRGYGGTVSAASLGVLPGVHPDCIVQLPPQEATLQPPPVNVTFPGPILSASPQGLDIGGYAPCAEWGYGRGFGYGGYGYGGLGYGRLGSRGFGYGKGGFLGRHGSVCLYPCDNVCY